MITYRFDLNPDTLGGTLVEMRTVPAALSSMEDAVHERVVIVLEPSEVEAIDRALQQYADAVEEAATEARRAAAAAAATPADAPAAPVVEDTTIAPVPDSNVVSMADRRTGRALDAPAEPAEPADVTAPPLVDPPSTISDPGAAPDTSAPDTSAPSSEIM